MAGSFRPSHAQKLCALLQRLSKLPWDEVSGAKNCHHYRLSHVVHLADKTFMNSLAMAEMSLILAVLFRPDGPRLALFETDESDVKQAHDFLIPLPKLDTKGVRAIVL